MTRMVFGLLLLVICTGCYTMNFYSDTDMLRVEEDGRVSTINTALAAIEIGEAAQLRHVCPGGVSRIEMQQTLVNGLFHYASVGFYSPQTAKVWCKRRPR